MANNRHWSTIEFKSAEVIALAVEVNMHPELIADLSSNPNATFEAKLGLVALFCGLEIDSYCGPKEIDSLCDLLTKELISRRSILLLPRSLH